MDNRYESMRQLKERLDELFGLCGIQTQPVDIRQAPALVRLAERLSRDEGLCSYFREVDRQTEQALQVMKERELDAWNQEQNERRIQELEQKCRDLQESGSGRESREPWELKQQFGGQYQGAQKFGQGYNRDGREVQEFRQELGEEHREAQELRQELEREHRATQELRQKLDEECREIQELKEKLNEERREIQELRQKLDEECQEEQQALMRLIRGVITVRDKLLIQKNWIVEQAPEEKNAYKIVDGQLRETARCLQNVGVELLEEAGSFDSRLHTVVETCPAEDAARADQVAETVRPGYRYCGEVIRPQEVVLYVAGDR